MATTIEQQVALDEALIPSTKRLRIRRSNFILPSDIQSKESTLQVVYDVLRRSPFFKAFLVTADVPEIYMDDILFSTIKVVSRHQNTQQYGAILPIELTTKDIRNTKAYKEYYAYATGEAAPKLKASARRKRGSSDSSTTPPTAVASPRPITTIAVTPRLTAAAKGKQPGRATSPTEPSEVHGGFSTDERTDVDDQDKSRDDNEGEKNDESDADDDDQDEAEKDDDDDDDDDDEEEIAKLDEQEDTESGEGDAKETESNGESEEEETREEEEESFDPIPRTLEDGEDDGNGKEDKGLRISEEERIQEEEEADELYCDVDINQGRGLQVSQDIEDSHVTLTLVHLDGQQESSSMSSFVTSMLNPISDAGVESIFTTASSSIAPLPTATPIMTPSTIATITTSSKAPIPPKTIPSATNQFAEAVSKIPGIVHQYMTQQMTEAVREVKSQVKEKVSRILPRIEESVNAQLEDEVLTRSSQSSRTSYAVVADLTEMELKKILIEKMEEINKTILESYGDTAILKRRRGDDDDQEGPYAGSDRGSKRQREGGEPESASTPSELTTRSADRSTTSTQSRQMSASAEDQPIVQTSQHPEWFSQPRKPPTPDYTPIDFSNFIMNRLGVDTLTPKLLARPTYELMRGSCTSLTELEYHLEEVYKATTDQLDWVNPEGQQYPHNLLQPLPLIPDNRGHRVIPFAHFINNDLEYLQGGTSSRKYTTSVTKRKATDYGHIKWIEDLVPRSMWIQEPLNYDKHALWGVSH
nr:hypothetical protein [Tanacetum cinerariifolium]